MPCEEICEEKLIKIHYIDYIQLNNSLVSFRMSFGCAFSIRCDSNQPEFRLFHSNTFAF